MEVKTHRDCRPGAGGFADGKKDLHAEDTRICQESERHYLAKQVILRLITAPLEGEIGPPRYYLRHNAMPHWVSAK